MSKLTLGHVSFGPRGKPDKWFQPSKNDVATIVNEAERVKQELQDNTKALELLGPHPLITLQTLIRVLKNISTCRQASTMKDIAKEALKLLPDRKEK